MDKDTRGLDVNAYNSYYTAKNAMSKDYRGYEGDYAHSRNFSDSFVKNHKKD